MNDAPSPVPSTPTSPAPTLEALAAAHESLRAAFHLTLLMLLVLSGSLSVFFLREISIARKQMTELTKVVRDYEKGAVPLVEELRVKLKSFAQAHPDFAPIYARYFGGTNQPPLTQGPGSAQPVGNPIAPRLPPNR